MTAEAEAQDDALVGTTVGKYELVRLIGVGGMGRVYEGVHATLGKRAALKFIDRESTSQEAVSRFMREAKAASAIESAHIVEVYDVGSTEDGRPFMVMELLRGEDLGQRIRRMGRLEVPEALRIVAQILRGLARAHEAGIVHRDLKPDNVFLVERDDDPSFAKLLDFGISKIQKRGGEAHQTITQEGTILGTPVYMSPEQAQALPDLDARTDIFSVGAILYECLCGRPPHSGATYEQIIVKICTKDADDVRLHNPAVSEGIASVVKRALERERDARYADVHQMLDDLVSHSEGALPASLGSDGLRRAVVRTPSSLGSARTLAAVSTVANTPPLENSLTRAQPAGRRGLLLVGVASVAIGGVATATLLGGGSTQPTASGVVPPVTVVVYSSAGPEVSAAPVATAEPSASASAAQLASASAEPGPSAKAAAPSRPPGGPRGSGPLATSTPAEPADLQLKLK